MCELATAMAIASFTIGAASSVMEYSAQSQQAKAQTAAYKQNIEASRSAAVNSYAAQQNKQLQARAAASQDLQSNQIDAIKARSTATVAAGEAGVSGLSVDALMGDFYAQEGRYERTLDQNYQMQADAIRSEMDGTEAQAESRMHSMAPGSKPSFMGAAVRVAGSAVGSYSMYTDLKSKEPA